MGQVTNVTETRYGYRCERCENVVPAESLDGRDRPEGYYVHMRRVTEMLNHHISEELYLCSKECLIGYVRWSISGTTFRVDPIGGKRRR